MRTRFLPLLFSLLAAGPARAGLTPDQTLAFVMDPGGWVFQKENGDGVRIYKKEVPDTPYYAYKGQLVTRVDPAKFRDIITDIPKAKGMDDDVPVRESEFLAGGVGSKQFDYYQYLDTPGWTLASDRWWINRAWVETDMDGKKGAVIMKWRSLTSADYPDKIKAVSAANPDAIFVPHNVGYWRLDPKDDGTFVITYAVLSDPGGKIPAKLQNLVTLNTLPDTILMYEKHSK